MISKTSKDQTRQKVHSRIRKTLLGTPERPRLNVYRSLNHIYAQVIDDAKGVTLASMDSRKVKGKTPVERAAEVGAEIAKKAKAAKIAKVVFDRNGYLYAGKIKVVADAARKGGLEF